MNVKFVNTIGRSRDSSDGIQTRRLWDRWPSNQRSIPVRDNRSFSSPERSNLHRGQPRTAGSFPGDRAVVTWSLSSHQYNSQVLYPFNYIYTPHVTKAWCVINDCRSAKFPWRLSCYMKVYMSRRQYHFLMEEHAGNTQNHKERSLTKNAFITSLLVNFDHLKDCVVATELIFDLCRY